MNDLTIIFNQTLLTIIGYFDKGDPFLPIFHSFKRKTILFIDPTIVLSPSSQILKTIILDI